MVDDLFRWPTARARGRDARRWRALALALLWRTDVHPAPGDGWQNLALARGQLYVSDQRPGNPGGALEVFPAAGCGQPVCEPAWSGSLGGDPVAGLTIGGDVLYVGLAGSFGERLVAFEARGCGAAVCPQIAQIDFGQRQPIQMAVADGRVAVIAARASAVTLRVLVPGS